MFVQWHGRCLVTQSIYCWLSWIDNTHNGGSCWQSLPNYLGVIDYPVWRCHGIFFTDLIDRGLQKLQLFCRGYFWRYIKRYYIHIQISLTFDTMGPLWNIVSGPGARPHFVDWWKGGPCVILLLWQKEKKHNYWIMFYKFSGNGRINPSCIVQIHCKYYWFAPSQYLCAYQVCA